MHELTLGKRAKETNRGAALLAASPKSLLQHAPRASKTGAGKLGLSTITNAKDTQNAQMPCAHTRSQPLPGILDPDDRAQQGLLALLQL